MNGTKKTSPWVYIGIGCAALVVLIITGVALMGYFSYRWAKQFEAEMKDPKAREAKALTVLGCKSLPAGYYPMVSMSIPFVMDMAMLSDEPPDARGEMRGSGQRGFFYFQYLNAREKDQELRDYFEGKTDDDSVLRRNQIDVYLQTKETIRRGVLKMPDHSLMFMAQRGSIEMGRRRGRSGRSDGINTLILVDCPHDTRMRMAFWFGPDPDPTAPVATANFVGTPADPNALRDFMGHFALCGKS
jgi:hypothetical protein